MTPKSDFTIIRRDGHDFIKLLNGRLIPVMAGGDDAPPPEPTLADIMKLMQQQGTLIKQQQDDAKVQQGRFDELVGAIREAMEDDGGEGGEEEGEGEEPQQQPQNRQPQQQQNQQPQNEEVAVLRREVTKMRKQLEETQNIIKQRESQIEEEREARLASQRDTFLQQALTESGVVPEAMDAAMKYFRDDILYDEENERFLFQEAKTGVKLGISEGVKDNLPSYFKQTTAKQGGSGGRGSQPNAMLETARNQLAKLHDQAKKSGNETDISAYHSAKKKVIELEQAAGGKAAGTPASAAPGGAVQRSAAPANRGQQPAGQFNDGES